MTDMAPVYWTTMISSILLVLVIAFVLARSKTLKLRLILIGVFMAIAAAAQGNVSGVSINPGNIAVSLRFSAGSFMKRCGDPDPVRSHARGAGPDRTGHGAGSERGVAWGITGPRTQEAGGDRSGRLCVFRGIPRRSPLVPRAGGAFPGADHRRLAVALRGAGRGRGRVGDHARLQAKARFPAPDGWKTRTKKNRRQRELSSSCRRKGPSGRTSLYAGVPCSERT